MNNNKTNTTSKTIPSKNVPDTNKGHLIGNMLDLKPSDPPSIY